MDWDYKLSSITRDTESNLARVRNRLDNSRHNRYSATPIINAPKILNNGSVGAVTPALQYVPMDQSPGVIMLLQDRLDEQAKAIENLMLTVRSLQHEREKSEQTIQELRKDQSAIMTRLAERGVNIETEHKLVQWRRDIAADMHAMQNQLQLHKGRGDDGTALTMTNELYESRKLIREECEAFRREIDAIKTRMVKLEIHITSVDGSTKELQRGHDRVERSMRDVFDVHQITSQDLTRTKDSVSRDKHELVELRSTFRNLQDRLGEMQAHISDTSSQRSYPRRRKPASRRWHNRSLPDGLTSPTDSELEFEELTRPRAFNLKSMPRKGISPPTSDLDDSDNNTMDILPPPMEYSTQQDPDSEDDYLLTDLNVSDNFSSDEDKFYLNDLK